MRQSHISLVQIERARARSHRRQVNLHAYVAGTDTTYHTLWTSYAHQGLGEAGGIDFEGVGNIAEFDGHLDFYFGNRRASQYHPQPDRQQQRDQFEHEILHEDPPEEACHMLVVPSWPNTCVVPA